MTAITTGGHIKFRRLNIDTEAKKLDKTRTSRSLENGWGTLRNSQCNPENEIVELL